MRRTFWWLAAATTAWMVGFVPPGQADAQSLAGKKIALDPGHGGTDPGAVGLGLEEEDVNLDVALRARDLLQAEGATVIMTRTCDCTVSLADRVATANNNGAHRFVAIHSNSCGGCGGHGTETYYHTSLTASSTAAALAGVVQDEMVSHLQTTNRGVKQADFYVLRNTDMPAVLVELGFVDHEGDNAKLAGPSWRQEAARAVLHAVQRHYGVPPHDPAPTFQVSIVSPSSTTWLRETVTAKGTSNQENNLNWMRFLVDGAITKWVTPAPHEWAWDTTGFGDGTRPLRLEGENQQGVRAADQRSVKIDNTPPTATIVDPEPGNLYVNDLKDPVPPALPATVLVGTKRVAVSSTDATSGVQRVEFRVDGGLRHTEFAAPYEFAWEAGKEKLGDHVLEARAFDVAGNQAATSLPVKTIPAMVPG